MLRGLGLLFLLFIAFSIFSNHGKDTSPVSKYSNPEPPKISEAQCRSDIQCYSEKFQANASIDCKKPIELRAKNDFQWTDAWYEQEFYRLRWDNRDKGSIDYIGDRVKFQNGFGAWTYMTYHCIYDTVGKRVTDVFLIDGRLPN